MVEDRANSKTHSVAALSDHQVLELPQETSNNNSLTVNTRIMVVVNLTSNRATANNKCHSEVNKTLDKIQWADNMALVLVLTSLWPIILKK